MGHVVIIRDAARSPFNWQLGKITALKTDKDGNVRSAMVKTNSRELERPISHLHNMEINKPFPFRRMSDSGPKSQRDGAQTIAYPQEAEAKEADAKEPIVFSDDEDEAEISNDSFTPNRLVKGNTATSKTKEGER